MAEVILGMDALQRRLQALHPQSYGRPLMTKLAMRTKAEAGLLVPRRTSNLAHSIAVVSVTETSARVAATANYAAYVERGTSGGQIIVPRNARVLAWPAAGVGTRATGRVRVGALRKLGSKAFVFAMRVRRGATPAKPYMVPGARKAIAAAALLDEVVTRWNDAA